MRNYLRNYKSFLRVGKKISRNNLKPRNLYKIQIYEGGDPENKVGMQERYVFVISRVKNYVHCIELKNVDPTDFIYFIKRIRDKRKIIREGQPLSEVLRKFTLDGKSLFNGYIKRNPKIFLEGKETNYRTYFFKNIRLCYELNFESDFLENVMNEKGTQSTIRDDVDREYTDLD